MPMIAPYRRHTQRCAACVAPDVTATCSRCLVRLCGQHAPGSDARCGLCEAEWAFAQGEPRGLVLRPLGFAALVSSLAVYALVGGAGSSLAFFGAVVVLLVGTYAPLRAAEAERRSFLDERFEEARW